MNTQVNQGLRPLVYGYCRDELAEKTGQSSRRDQEIEAFADREGFDLGTVFHESGPGRGAFMTLIQELKRAESQHVVVPSIAHLWGRGARQALVAQLWGEAHASMLVSKLMSAGHEASCGSSDSNYSIAPLKRRAPGVSLLPERLVGPLLGSEQ